MMPGRVTNRKVCTCSAPSVAAASSSRGSRLNSDEATENIRNGRLTTVIPTEIGQSAPSTPALVNSTRKAKAEAISGVATPRIRYIPMVKRNGNLNRTSAIAAGTPVISDSTTTCPPTIRLRHSASRIASLPISAR